MANSVSIYIWNVAHGNAIYIQTPTGKKIVIDLGAQSLNKTTKSGYSDFDSINHVCKNYTKVIDHLIITHPHKDHIECIEKLQHLLSNGELTVKSVHYPSDLTDKLIKDYLKSRNIKDGEGPKYRINYYRAMAFNKKVRNVKELSQINSKGRPESREGREGRVINIGEVKLTIYYPYRHQSKNLNEYSLVTILEYGNFKMVLPGDNERRSQEELLSSTSFKKKGRNATILFASHHGRDSGYHKDFVEHVNPNTVVVSDANEKETVDEEYKKSMKRKPLNVNGKPQKVVCTSKMGRVRITVTKSSRKATISTIDTKQSKLL